MCLNTKIYIYEHVWKHIYTDMYTMLYQDVNIPKYMQTQRNIFRGRCTCINHPASSTGLCLHTNTIHKNIYEHIRIRIGIYVNELCKF